MCNLLFSANLQGVTPVFSKDFVYFPGHRGPKLQSFSRDFGHHATKLHSFPEILILIERILVLMKPKLLFAARDLVLMVPKLLYFPEASLSHQT